MVIDHLERRHDSTTVLYFFCRYDAVWSHSVDRVLANLLGQIVHHRGDLSHSMSALYDEYRSLPNTVPPLNTILNALVSEIRAINTPVYLIVDALDEFSSTNDGRHQQLVEQLEKFRVPLMVISRKPVPFTTEPRAYVGIYANDEDILLYMQERCRRGPWSNVVRSMPDLRNEICEGVRRNSEGM